MALFQNSVLKRHLKGLDNDLMKEKYKAFSQYFLHPTIQDNIRESKEEQFQATFLNELFVKVLGYTLNPSLNHNLTTEYKNVKDAKKADGAIIQDKKAIAVIELKGTNTTDLNKVESQAFGYKNNQPDAVYIITSNFEKLRFYIDNAVDYEEFNLFHLSFERFKILWLCLSKDNIFNGLPKRIKDTSLTEEENVTKHLYKDYSAFRNDMFNSVVQLNPEFDKLVLFKKTQKLLDRFLFIFFAEDGGLLPPNSIKSIIDQWVQLRDELDAYTPLYSRFKKFFGYMNTGYKGKKHDIFAYNGGLFQPDDILDNIKIDDALLYTHTQKLSAYDFESEVDVNILGHIFEHSLNEIEEMTAEIEGTTVEKSKTKRKKDGVFYTPKYITKYIVENTVGQLCENKKAELAIDEAEYNKSRKGRKKATLKTLKTKLDDYRNWLLGLTICDPACGSGAFLNQALSFLIEEHHYVDELQTKLLGGSLVFPNVENAILENNLYGVDINEESVEIAKLSLWLRSAKPERKLTSLNSNIKCGNSLIDDPTVAGEKAFNWYTAFPKVFVPKNKQAYHIVLTTHNSRTSQRMKQMMVEKGEPVELNLSEEIELTKIIRDIVKEYDYQCLAYNVCKDHVHLVLVCEFEELSRQVQRLKSIASRKFNILTGKTIPRTASGSVNNHPMGHDPLPANMDTTSGTMGHDPLDKKKRTQNHLWSQKFFYANLDVWELATLSKRAGYTYDDPYIGNAIRYIENNRVKHQLPASTELQNLIASFTTSSEKAFELEYKGGFDVVIGNPPYGILIDEKEEPFFREKYPLTSYKINLYVLFLEKMLYNFKNSVVHFIIPKSLLFNSYYSDIRKSILENAQVHEIMTISDKVFEDAEVGDSLLLKFTPKIKSNTNLDSSINLISVKSYFDTYSNKGVFNSETQKYFLSQHNHEIVISDKRNKSIKEKIQSLKTIKDHYILKNGLNPGNVKHILITTEKRNDNHKPIIWGRDISKYNLTWSKDYINYDETVKDTISLDDLRSKKGMKKQNRIDFALRTVDIFENEKLLVRKTGDSLISVYDNENYYYDTLAHGILVKDKNWSLKSLLAIINSKAATYFYRILHDIKGKVFAKISLVNLGNFPIPNIDDNTKILLENKVNLMLDLNKTLEKKSSRFHRRLQTSFEIEKLSKKLQAFYEYDFKTFLQELKKEKVKLKLSEQDEWEDYFNDYKTAINQLQAEIAKTDKEIDAMVYELYGLTEDEIKIVENA